MDILVRQERKGDPPVIADVVRRAYADVPYSDRRESVMVERLRSTDAFVPELSLVAQIAGQAVGHILLTRALIRNGPNAIATLALAPLSVVPEYQRQGVGARLVEAAHARAASLGFGSVLLVGIPGYYDRFGYQPLSRYPITLPFQAPEANCRILPLSPTALDGVSGEVEYAPGWLDH